MASLRVFPFVVFLLLGACNTLGPSYTPLGAITNQSFAGADDFNDQTYVAIDPGSHDILVSNTINDEVGIFTAAYSFVASPSFKSGAFNWPNGIAIDPISRNLVVFDSNNSRVVIFTPSGASWAFASAFGTKGSGPGQFALNEYPGVFDGVAVDGANHAIFVADSGNNRIQMFSATGQFLAQFGANGGGPGQFSNPQGVAIDPISRNVIVADGGNARVQIFDVNHNFLASFGGRGAGNGQFAATTGGPSDFT